MNASLKFSAWWLVLGACVFGGCNATSEGVSSSSGGAAGAGGASGSGGGTAGGGAGGISIPACGLPGAKLETSVIAKLPGRGIGITFSPDGSRIAASGRFRSPSPSPRYDVKIYDSNTGEFVKEFGCPDYWTSAVVWSENPTLGNVIASGNYGHAVELWDTSGPGTTSCPSVPKFDQADGGILKLPLIDGAVTWLSFSPNGHLLAAANRDPSIRLWQLQPGDNQFKVVAYWSEPYSANFSSVAWSPDGKRLAATERSGNTGRLAVWAFDETTDLWDQGRIDAFAKLARDKQESWANQAANLPLTRRIPLWSLDGGAYWTTDFSPDGAKVAAVSADGILAVFDATTGVEVFHFNAPMGEGFMAMDYSPAGDFIAAGSTDGNIYLIDAKTGQLADTLVGHHNALSALAWSSDACALVSTAGGPRICAGGGLTTCHECSGADGICPEWSDDLDARIWRFVPGGG